MSRAAREGAARRSRGRSAAEAEAEAERKTRREGLDGGERDMCRGRDGRRGDGSGRGMKVYIGGFKS